MLCLTNVKDVYLPFDFTSREQFLSVSEAVIVIKTINLSLPWTTRTDHLLLLLIFFDCVFSCL